ncbi:hypothetical protein PG995_005077 [Apiospora arundinis]
MTEQLVDRSVTNKVLLKVHEDGLEKNQWELNERLKCLVALSAPTHQPGSIAETCKPVGNEITQSSFPPSILAKDSRTLENSQGVEAASASEMVPPLTRSSSTTSAVSHSNPSSSTTDKSLDSGTSYVTTIGSTGTSEDPEVCELVKGVFVAPKQPIPGDHLEQWNSIKSRLEDALLNLFKPKAGLDPSLSLEFVMAGPSKAPLKPSILLTCCNEPHRKHLKRLLKSQKWLASTGYHLIVVVDPIQQLSSIQRRDESSSFDHNNKLALGLGLGLGMGFIVLCLLTVTSIVLWRRRYLSKGASARETDENGNRILCWIRAQDSGGTAPVVVSRLTSDATTCCATVFEADSRVDVTEPAASSTRTASFNGNINKLPEFTQKLPLRVYAQADSPYRHSLCGVPALAYKSGSRHTYFTIGGMILVNGTMFGLTTGHSFEYLNREQCTPENGPISTTGPDPRWDSDSDSDLDSASPWVSFGQESEDNTTIAIEVISSTHQPKDEVDRIPSFSSGSGSNCHSHPTKANELLSKGLYIGTVKSLDVMTCNHKPNNAKLDWAMIELDEYQRWTVNALYEDSSNPEEILEMAEATHLEDGEVTVTAGFTGLTQGWLRQSPVMVRIRSRTYEAQQIILENHLVRGDSGAWVVRNGMFCGHIIAQKTLSPVAYMLPAQSLLEDIKRCMNTSNVSLPGSSIETKVATTYDTPSDGNQPAHINQPVNQSTKRPGFSTSHGLLLQSTYQMEEAWPNEPSIELADLLPTLNTPKSALNQAHEGPVLSTVAEPL